MIKLTDFIPEQEARMTRQAEATIQAFDEKFAEEIANYELMRFLGIPCYDHHVHIQAIRDIVMDAEMCEALIDKLRELKLKAFK